jgi:L-threonylcarbamoyladenylate synthase
VLRPGPITSADLCAVLGQGEVHEDRGIEAPGQMTSHYAPGKPVRLNAAQKAAEEFYITFGSRVAITRFRALATLQRRLRGFTRRCTRHPMPRRRKWRLPRSPMKALARRSTTAAPRGGASIIKARRAVAPI